MYNSENDEWIIPFQTSGLKRKKVIYLIIMQFLHYAIPSNPEINKHMAKVREITGGKNIIFIL